MVVSDLQVDPGQRFEPAVEYSHVLASIRHFSSVRLAQLLIFFLVMGGLLLFLSEHRFAASGMGSLTARAFGSFVTMIFWLLDVRAGKQYIHMLRRAQSLERILHFHSYLEPPRKPRPTNRRRHPPALRRDPRVVVNRPGLVARLRVGQGRLPTSESANLRSAMPDFRATRHVVAVKDLKSSAGRHI